MSVHPVDTTRIPHMQANRGYASESSLRRRKGLQVSPLPSVSRDAGMWMSRRLFGEQMDKKHCVGKRNMYVSR